MDGVWSRALRGIGVGGIALALAGCATYPQGPSVMALPGSRTSFEQFQHDDALCRDWAAHQTGIPTQDAAIESGVATAAVVTAVGAAAGLAIGAAAGNPGAGAAIGAGSGLLVGSAVGASSAHASGLEVQDRYDASYVQCMYAKGNRVPVARGAVPLESSAPPPPRRRDLPAPPRGRPPPPPPDAS